MNKSINFFTLFVFTSLLFVVFPTNKLAFAENGCGAGYTCGSQGGSGVLINACTPMSGWCANNGTSPDSCSCGGSDCSCTLTNGGTSCDYSPGSCSCSIPGGSGCSQSGDSCGTTAYPSAGSCTCSSGSCDLSGTSTVHCCEQISTGATPTPTSPPGGGGSEPPPPPGATSTPTPTPTPTPYISGIFYEDDGNAIVSGDVCIGGGTSSISPDASIQAEQVSTAITYTSPGIVGSIYELIVGAIATDDYKVTLDLTAQPDPENQWSCSCPASGDPFLCEYDNIDAPQTDVHFYLVNNNLSNTGWWQASGGNAFGYSGLVSKIPSTTCTVGNDCYAGMLTGLPFDHSNPNSIILTAGFPITSSGGIINTQASGGTGYVHSPGSRNNADGSSNADLAYIVGSTSPAENYFYFNSKFGSEASVKTDNIKPASGIYKYTGNMTIDENNPWAVSNSEQIIVFVNGNLTIDDTAASANRIITVAKGGTGFLAFIVSGNINITSNVGHSSPATDQTVEANSLVEGVFVADGALTIEDDGDPNVADKKFIGSGTFVGWGGVDLNRDFSDNGLGAADNNTNPAEVFIFRPDFVINMPMQMKSAQYTWQEVAPELL